MKTSKVLVIVGPTASGKSALAVKLAKKLKGEIISADSRQVYKGLDVGTGKVTKKEMGGIPHHLMDIVSPNRQFSAAQYKKKAQEALKQIISKDKLPIIVGGTGFYIDALTGSAALPDVPPNKKLRRELANKTTEELFKLVKKKDPRRAKSIDRHNKVRLIRALEIIAALGHVPNIPTFSRMLECDLIYIGLLPQDLDARIRQRLMKRLAGIIRETKKLSYKRAYELGLEYRFAAEYLRGKYSKKEFIEKLFTAIRQYSKRQMTWFKRNNDIKWFQPEQYREIEKYARMALLGD